MAAIAPLYRDHALHYATLEAGHMTQLLEAAAPAHNIGLCQTGGLETATLREHLALGQHHLVLHGLLGGRLPAADVHPHADSRAAGNSPDHSTDDSADERDEGEL
jgi:hypothetical protein